MGASAATRIHPNAREPTRRRTPGSRPVATPARRLVDPAPVKPGVRQLAAITTRDSILRAATKVFAKHGYDGGSIDQISKAARSYDRMIYYYFGSKEGLFIAVIEEVYRRFNEAEATLELDEAKPVQALAAVIRFVWSYYQRNPDFITLLNTENLHRGRHIAKSLRARELSSPVIGVTARVLAAGVKQKLFRPDLAARDVYLMIAALGYFYLSNRYTLSAFLGESIDTPAALAHWEGFMIDAVLRKVSAAR
jgi:TetR/AcrR family transcriptional regulator, upper aerobic nicotinate degradation pathway regulator